MKFCKKPVVIEAFELHPDDNKTRQLPPRWFIDALMCGKIVANSDGSVIIKTLEGPMLGNVGDWVIQGVKGELYPCKPDIFTLTYEPVIDIGT